MAIVINSACAEKPTQIAEGSNNTAAGATTPASATPAPTDSQQLSDVPEHFKSVDFRHMRYPTHYFGTITLKDGVWEKEERLGGTTIDLTDVHYVDMNNNGDPLAIVKLTQVICGGSCDGSSALFYFFAATHKRPVLLSQIETGSLAYTCGLKSFVLKGRVLTLEAFRKCSFSAGFLKSAYDADRVGGKFVANEFTRFTLRFDGKRFVLLNRSLLPYSDGDTKNYREKTRMNNER